MDLFSIALIIVALVVGYGVLQLGSLVSMLRQVLGLVYRTDNLASGIDSMDHDMRNQPKSISAATSLYLPKIKRDFPEFDYKEMLARAKNVLISYLRSIDKQDVTQLSEGTPELEEQLLHFIKMQVDRGEHEHYQSIHIHRMEISDYRTLKGSSYIIFQAAVEYFHFIEKEGQLLSGRKEFKEQGKFEVEVCYVQDAEVVENIETAGLALNCPNCGAPLKDVGAKVCQYCGAPVIELNLKVWNFTRVTKIG